MEAPGKMRSEAPEGILCICAMGRRLYASFVQTASIGLHLRQMSAAAHNESC